MDVFPLPRIDNSLDSLAHSKYFTTLDLAAGYWQVPMDAESQEKTAFVTHSGFYEFWVMPFGLCNAPATFQRLMEAGLARDSCMVYLDDILVIGRTFPDHLRNLSRVFGRLREAGLCLKPAKCHFAAQCVEYLGYVVTGQGISADPKKVEAIMSFPVPQDVKAVRSFTGLASYYRRFIPSFSKIAAPLFALTKKDAPFCWDSCSQDGFETEESHDSGSRVGVSTVWLRFSVGDRCLWDWARCCTSSRAAGWTCLTCCICQPHSTTARAQLWSHGIGGTGCSVGS